MPNQHPSGLAHVAKVFHCMQQLAEELHKPIIRKFEKRKLYPSFKDNILGADLAGMQLTSKYKKANLCFYCAISKYA